MTQEELDALMAGGLDDEDLEEDDTPDGTTQNETDEDSDKKEDIAEDAQLDDDKDYGLKADKAWPPPPPTEDHKVVEQLDDVTKDSEIKATEIFDKLEAISDFIMQVENDANNVSATIQKNIDIFIKLSGKFPDIKIFDECLQNNENALKDIENLITNAQMSSDEIMMIMDIMQYQDIHRQKIERVINVIRTLASYMNSLFSAEKDDSKRVSSAVHIAGDSSTEDVVSNDDIEALIESLGKK